MSNLELWNELANIPPCSLCRAPAYRAGCLRCEARRHLFVPATEAQRAAHAAQARMFEEQRLRAAALEQERIGRLRALARPVRVGLISCGRAKRAHAAPARDLYVSSLFKLSLRAAKAWADEVFIVSALHGLVSLDRVLEPYEVALHSLRHRERGAWGARVASALQTHLHGLPVELRLYAGAEYARWIRVHLPRTWTVHEPLRGLPLGQRLRHLSATSNT